MESKGTASGKIFSKLRDNILVKMELKEDSGYAWLMISILFYENNMEYMINIS